MSGSHIDLKALFGDPNNMPANPDLLDAANGFTYQILIDDLPSNFDSPAFIHAFAQNIYKAYKGFPAMAYDTATYFQPDTHDAQGSALLIYFKDEVEFEPVKTVIHDVMNKYLEMTGTPATERNFKCVASCEDNYGEAAEAIDAKMQHRAKYIPTAP